MGERREWPIVKIIKLQLETPFAEGYVNAFAAIGETATLIDTGNPGKKSFLEFKSLLRQNGLQLSDFDQIVLTHMHTDHSGGIELIREETDIPVYIHEQASISINGGKLEHERNETFYHGFLKQCGADASIHKHAQRYREINWGKVHYIKDGDRLPIGDDWFEVVYVPGHSQSDILLWNPKTGDAFSGDHLVANMSVNAFIEPPYPGSTERPKPLLQFRDSLKKVRMLPLCTVYPGHGEVFINHLDGIDKRFLEQEKRFRFIREALKDGAKSVFEICKILYPQLKGKMIFLGLSQIQGHLDLLELNGEVEANERDSVFFYRLAQ
nr:MBL fold metallo-hydrolase [Mesobacillus harenae]